MFMSILQFLPHELSLHVRERNSRLLRRHFRAAFTEITLSPTTRTNSHLGRQALQSLPEYYSFARINLRCDVGGVDLKTEAKPEGV